MEKTEVRYYTDEFGVIHQLNPPRFEYTENYFERSYDTYPKAKLHGLACQRLGFLASVIGIESLRRVLDVGYGRGDFLRACAAAGLEASGYDIAGCDVGDPRITIIPPLADGSLPWEVFQPFSCVTFFDVLEHFHDISFIVKLRAQHVAISLPWCHWSRDDPKFWDWKHRKPGEHLHHFNDRSLREFMASQGFETLWIGCIEDAVRSAPQAEPNILTGVFRRS